MNRRDFIKQSAVIVTGVATKVLPVIEPSQSVIYLGYSEKLKAHIWKQDYLRIKEGEHGPKA